MTTINIMHRGLQLISSLGDYVDLDFDSDSPDALAAELDRRRQAAIEDGDDDALAEHELVIEAFGVGHKLAVEPSLQLLNRLEQLHDQIRTRAA